MSSVKKYTMMPHPKILNLQHPLKLEPYFAATQQQQQQQQFQSASQLAPSAALAAGTNNYIFFISKINYQYIKRIRIVRRLEFSECNHKKLIRVGTSVYCRQCRKSSSSRNMLYHKSYMCMRSQEASVPPSPTPFQG